MKREKSVMESSLNAHPPFGFRGNKDKKPSWQNMGKMAKA
jgi:hypothetical protein